MLQNDSGSYLNAIQGENRTLATQVYNAIKDAILSLELPPGTPIVEDELAARLGTSKTPVRNALVKLEQDGLVVRIAYKGTYVSEISPEDAREIFELRAVLEGLAARLAVPWLTSEEVEEAEHLLAAADEALSNNDIIQASALGEQFHKVIYKHATNQRVLIFLRLLDDQLRRLRLISNNGMERMKKSAGEHRRILDALKQRNPELVEKALRDHHHSVLEDLALEPAKPADPSLDGQFKGQL